jgi:hypothetical protein
MNWRWWGLAVFVFMAVAIGIFLIYDWYLEANDYDTISDYCRDHPGVAWLLLTGMEFGIMGFAVHLMVPKK